MSGPMRLDCLRTTAEIAALERAHLIMRRREEYAAAHGPHTPDFAPADGICWSCKADLVTERWPTDFFSGCPKCHRSYCD